MIGLADFVRAQTLSETRQRMRHRLDASRRCPIELADEGEDPGEGLRVSRDFRVGKLEAGKAGDAGDVVAGEAHGCQKVLAERLKPGPK